ncbi:MAG: hypothetical protein SVM79_05725 [Chloroflexota bacterium]|nr:hypothetical protein [Chloroflexota bacterium]
MKRFNTDNAYVWSFGNEFLIVCPRCNKRAIVKPLQKESGPEARVSCSNCGYSKNWVRKSHGVLFTQNREAFDEGEIGIGDAVDWYFHHPLWLQEKCCGEVLWAYNREHLEWLRSFVSATIRERKEREDHGWSNRALASRLPRWISQANNRRPILAAISKMEKRL